MDLIPESLGSVGDAYANPEEVIGAAYASPTISTRNRRYRKFTSSDDQCDQSSHNYANTDNDDNSSSAACAASGGTMKHAATIDHGRIVDSDQFEGPLTFHGRIADSDSKLNTGMNIFDCAAAVVENIQSVMDWSTHYQDEYNNPEHVHTRNARVSFDDFVPCISYIVDDPEASFHKVGQAVRDLGPTEGHLCYSCTPERNSTRFCTNMDPSLIL